MIRTYISKIITRDLECLRRELLAYEREQDLWATPEGTANSAGTLALHLTGNLQHYIGAVLGSSSYQRDRAAEFADRDTPRDEILARIDASILCVQSTLQDLPDLALEMEFPEPVGGVCVTTLDFLIHLASHLAFHVGQVDYHRRILTGGASVAPLGIRELASATPRA
jgi:uncharacterized damage-inducible protein DinB